MNFRSLRSAIVATALLVAARGVAVGQHDVGQIYNAASGYDPTPLNALLEEGLSPDFEFEDGWTLLVNAVWDGNATIAESVLEHGANPTLHDPFRRGFRNMELSDQQVIDLGEVFIRHYPQMTRESDWVATAIASGRYKVAEWLIEHGFPLGINRDELNPLVEAIAEQNHVWVERLLEAGADPNVLVREGYYHTEGYLEPRYRTPLQIAVAVGDTSIVRTLLDAGADPNRTWYFAEALPLTEAFLEENAPTLVPLLLKHGANPNAIVAARDKMQGVELNGTADHGFHQYYYVTPVHVAPNDEVLTRLVSAGATPDAPSALAERFLKAVRSDDTNALSELASAGFDLRTPIIVSDTLSYQPIHFALENRTETTARYLLAHSGPLRVRECVEIGKKLFGNEKSDLIEPFLVAYGKSLIDHAVSIGDRDLLVDVIRRRPELAHYQVVREDKRQALLEYALERHDDELVRMLRDAGADLHEAVMN